MTVEITGFDWVPDFARGFVRDLRPRWACEEAGIPYRMRLVNAATPRPEAYFKEQPWGQVPVLKDDGVSLFESGAILLYLGEKDERLLPRDPQGRATTIAWLFAAYNSIEPWMMELGNIEIFAAGEEWAKLRKPGLLEYCGQRFDRLSDALDGKEWLTGTFSIADIAMVCALRAAEHTDLLSSRPILADYMERALARPAYRRALDAQLSNFRAEPTAA